jgi:hypothetical protein
VWAAAPFPGIVERPYDQDDLVDTDWSAVAAEFVEFRNLWLTQTRLSVAAMLGQSSYSTDAFPRAVHFAGQMFLEDGHHRIVRAALQGWNGTNVRVIRTPVRSRPVVVSQGARHIA